MSVHDLVFAAGSAVLLAAIVPAVVRRTVLPRSTCLVTGGVLVVFSVNYLTMRYWYAMTVEGLNAACWTCLTVRAFRG